MDDGLHLLIANLDAHFNATNVVPANAAYWAGLKRRLIRMKDGLDLARLELEAGTRAPEERVRKALQHVRFGLGAKEG